MLGQQKTKQTLIIFSLLLTIKERQGLSFSMRSLTTAKIRRDNLSPSVLSVLLSLA
jgi:hypothetical protein